MVGTIMRVYRVFVILLLAAVFIAISGCIEFGALPDTPPDPSQAVPPSASNTPTPEPQISDSQVSITLKAVTSNQTSDGRQSEHFLLTLENTGTTDIASVHLTYGAEDPVASELLSSGSVSAGSIPAGGQTDVTVSLPRYDYLRTITFSAAAHWGSNPGYVNDRAGPWSVSLVTNQFWEK